eukprot:2594621-Amphidinium_carterae.1
MSEPRYGCAAAALHNFLVVLGGMGSKREPLSSVEMYNPITKEWACSTSMRVVRSVVGSSYKLKQSGKTSSKGAVVLESF